MIQKKILLVSIPLILYSCANSLVKFENVAGETPKSLVIGSNSNGSFIVEESKKPVSATPVKTPLPSSTPTPLPSCEPPQKDKKEPIPDFYSRKFSIILKGQIFDQNGNFVNGAVIKAKSIGSNWEGSFTSQGTGVYMFPDAPLGYPIEITVSKEGQEIKKRNVTINTNDTCTNIFNFGGNDYPGDTEFAL